MTGRKWRRAVPALAAALILIISLLCVQDQVFSSSKVYKFKKTNEVLKVPYSGYAPDARSEDLCEDSTLVYVEVTLRELEPEENVYDFSSIEKEFNINKWKAQGKHMVLRLVLDDPSDEAHRDIPDWLYDETADGTDYDNEYGKGYCPNYSNPVLIEAHRKAVAALASWAEKDGFAAYVEIGSLGHWGEWHILQSDTTLPSFPDKEVQQEYVDAYTSAFKSAKLLMRRPFSVRPAGAGVYNDMTGDEDDTNEWLSWIADGGTFEQTGEALSAAPKIWKKAPVGGEFTSGTSMNKMMGSSYKTTKKLVQRSHMTFIGPMIPTEVKLTSTAKKNARDLLRYVGPRYRVSRAELSGGRRNSYVTLTVTNDGTCPVYFKKEKLVLYVRGKNSRKSRRIVTKLDLTGISQNEKKTVKVKLTRSYKSLRSSKVMAGIETSRGKDRIPLFMKAKRTYNLSVISSGK